MSNNSSTKGTYYERNREKILEYQKEYRSKDENREKANKRSKEYYRKHKEERQEYGRRYKKKYYKKNKEKLNADSKRRSRIMRTKKALEAMDKFLKYLNSDMVNYNGDIKPAMNRLIKELEVIEQEKGTQQNISETVAFFHKYLDCRTVKTEELCSRIKFATTIIRERLNFEAQK